MSEDNTRPVSDYTRRVWIAAVIVATVAGLAMLLWFSLSILLMCFAGLLLTLLFSLPTDWLHRHSFLSRRLSLLVVLVAIIAAVVIFILNFAQNLGQEFERLSEVLPNSLSELKERIGQYPLGEIVLQRIDQTSSPDELLGGWSSRVTTMFSDTLDMFLNAVAVVLVGLFVAFEPDLYRRGAIALIFPSRRDDAREFLGLVEKKMAWWLMGRFISMSAVGVCFGVGLWLLGMPMAVSLGILAGFLSFIPYLGPILALIPALLVAFTLSSQMMVYVGILYLGVQFLESNLITPLVQREAVSIPPALLLLVQLGLGFYAGILGLLLAEPLIVLTMLAVQHFYVQGWLENKSQLSESRPQSAQ